MTSNGTKERSLAQNCIWIIENGLVQERFEIDSTFLPVFFSDKNAIEHFPIAL